MGPNISDLLQNLLPPEIRSPLFNLQKFEDSAKTTPQSCRMHQNLINDDKFGSTKLLNFKYSRGDQIIQAFCKIGSPQKLGPPSFTCRNFKTLKKYSSIMKNALTSNEWWLIWVHKTFKIEIQKGVANNSDFLQNWVPPEIRSPSLICRIFKTLKKVLLKHAECIEI